jgi:glycosyltransferase involved in cell wall biosynthesis
VSVIIATHNYGRFLPDAVRSVQAQSYKDWECVIVDDASTDLTEKVAAELIRADRRIRYIRNPRNLGEAGSRNVGNTAARGEFVASLDADDWWHPDKLRVQLDALRQSPGAVVSFASSVITSAEGEERLHCCSPSYLRRLDRGLHCENQLIHSSAVVRRTALHAVGGYDEQLPTAPDWDLWLRLLHQFGAGAFVVADAPLVYYRVHGSNISSNRAKMTRAEWIIIRRSLLRGWWGLRHPLAIWSAVDCQLGRELGRAKKAGAIREAFWRACGQVALSPLRRWRWRQAVHLFTGAR